MNSLNGVIKSKKEDVYTILASTKAVDRDREIILPSAFKNLDSYLKNNPVILGFHNYYDFPIGKAVSGQITDDALVLDIVFAQTEMGKEAKYLFDNGFMNSFSVGFIPKAWDFDGDNRRVYSDVELLEVSAVPVPSNATATMMREAEKAGMSLKYFKQILDKESKQPAKADDAEMKVKEEGLNKINKMKRKYLWI